MTYRILDRNKHDLHNKKRHPTMSLIQSIIYLQILFIVCIKDDLAFLKGRRSTYFSLKEVNVLFAIGSSVVEL